MVETLLFEKQFPLIRFVAHKLGFAVKFPTYDVRTFDALQMLKNVPDFIQGGPMITRVPIETDTHNNAKDSMGHLNRENLESVEKPTRVVHNNVCRPNETHSGRLTPFVDTNEGSRNKSKTVFVNLPFGKFDGSTGA